MNKYCQIYYSSFSPRSFVFAWVIQNVLFKKENLHIVEIGGIRPNDAYNDFGFQSDGFSTFYWADVLRKKGQGKLTIVDIDSKTIQIAKEVLSDFEGVDIEFVCGDGLEFLQSCTPNFVYLDGLDNINITYQMFNKIDRTKASILCDDASFHTWDWGKCLLLRVFRPGYYAFKLPNTTHEMIFYPEIGSELDIARQNHKVVIVKFQQTPKVNKN